MKNYQIHQYDRKLAQIEEIQRILGLSSFGMNNQVNSFIKTFNDYKKEVLDSKPNEQLAPTEARDLVEKICLTLDKLAKTVERYPEARDILPKLDCMKELLEEVAEISEGKQV